MNRRQVLKALLAAPAIAVIPEIIVPKRTIFLPPRRGWPLGCTTIDVDDLIVEMGYDVKVLNGWHGWPVTLARGHARGMAQGFVSAEQLVDLERAVRIRGVPGDWRAASVCHHSGPLERAHVNLVQVWT